MKAMAIIFLIVLAIVLLLQLRAGVRVCYRQGGLTVTGRLGPLRLALYPPKAEKQKKQKKPKKEEAPKVDDVPPPGGKLELARALIPVVGEGAGRLRRKISIDVIHLQITWGSDNPATAAMGFGYASMTMGMLWPILEHNFKIKKQKLGVDVDFAAPKPTLFLDAQATLTLGQGLWLALTLGTKCLKIYKDNQTVKEGASL